MTQLLLLCLFDWITATTSEPICLEWSHSWATALDSLVDLICAPMIIYFIFARWWNRNHKHLSNYRPLDHPYSPQLSKKMSKVNTFTPNLRLKTYKNQWERSQLFWSRMWCCFPDLLFLGNYSELPLESPSQSRWNPTQGHLFKVPFKQ